jgi:tetratricopeptide (TPR) repeat protein
MSKEVKKATAKATASTEILGLCKPQTGGKLKGWAICRVTKKDFTLFGEEELSHILNGSKSTLPKEVITACKKGLDLAHALTVAHQIAAKLNYTPCKAVRLYGEGATALVKRYDAATEKLKKYTTETATALKALLESKEGNRKKAFAAYDEAVKAEKSAREAYKEAMKKYRKDTETATALLTMNDLRKA